MPPHSDLKSRMCLDYESQLQFLSSTQLSQYLPTAAGVVVDSKARGGWGSVSYLHPSLNNQISTANNYILDCRSW